MPKNGGGCELFVLDIGRGIVYNGIIVGATYEKGAWTLYDLGMLDVTGFNEFLNVILGNLSGEEQKTEGANKFRSWYWILYKVVPGGGGDL